MVNDIAPKDRDIAMVFQSYALYPHMSVRGQPRLRAEDAQRREAARARPRAARSRGRLGIGEQLARRPRAALAAASASGSRSGRAIVREPQAFLMDEPLSNLDAKLRVEMRAYIARLHQELGTTTLYVTHDQTEAMTMGDRVAVMRDGRLEQVDAPQELYDRPANLFVAAFIGSPAMNLLRGRLELHRGPRAGRCSAASASCSPTTLLDARPVLARLGRRGGRGRDPARGRRRGDADTPAGSVLELEVVLVEALGSDLLVHLRTDAPRVTVSDAFDGEEDAGLEARFTARLPPHVRVRGRRPAAARGRPRAPARLRPGDRARPALAAQSGGLARRISPSA